MGSHQSSNEMLPATVQVLAPKCKLKSKLPRNSLRWTVRRYREGTVGEVHQLESCGSSNIMHATAPYPLMRQPVSGAPERQRHFPFVHYCGYVVARGIEGDECSISREVSSLLLRRIRPINPTSTTRSKCLLLVTFLSGLETVQNS